MYDLARFPTICLDQGRFCLDREAWSGREGGCEDGAELGPGRLGVEPEDDIRDGLVIFEAHVEGLGFADVGRGARLRPAKAGLRRGRRAMFPLRVINTSLAEDIMRLLMIFFGEGKRNAHAKAQRAQGEGVIQDVMDGKNFGIEGFPSGEKDDSEVGLLMVFDRLPDSRPKKLCCRIFRAFTMFPKIFYSAHSHPSNSTRNSLVTA